MALAAPTANFPLPGVTVTDQAVVPLQEKLLLYGAAIHRPCVRTCSAC